MIVQGKYNSAEIFTSNVDSTTISQIVNLCNQEMFKDSIIKIMPDCHAGKGCTIGTVMTVTDKIVPNLVGVDIGCGMSMAAIDIKSEEDLKEIDNIIRKYIPHGFNCHKNSKENILKNIFDIDLRKLKCSEHINIERAFFSLGTLGGGNHFIEINENADKDKFLTVHSGSRNLGKNVADYYQLQAIKYCKEKHENRKKEIIEKLKKENREKEISIELSKIKKPEDDLCYLEGKLMEDYLHDMNIVQKFATANRIHIISEILFNYYNSKETLNLYCKLIKNTIINCTHNYIDIENKILRKGAIQANKDELVIIPMNMRDGIILGYGKGNPNWNYSAPHGAGRILSRGKAKSEISLEEFEESMKNIYTTSVGTSTLDEAPQAYKPMQEIVENIKDTVDILDIYKPIYNFKSN